LTALGKINAKNQKYERLEHTNFNISGLDQQNSVYAGQICLNSNNAIRTMEITLNRSMLSSNRLNKIGSSTLSILTNYTAFI
jgi:hypothetical protein